MKISQISNKNKKVIYFIVTLSLVVMIGIFSNVFSKKVDAIGLCTGIVNPTIRVDIDGQTFWGSGSITVPSGAQVPFTVWTYSDPSSPNSITYPGGATTYPGPCGNLCPSGRSYTTAPINSQGFINIDLTQNCTAPPVPPSTSLSITINVAPPACAISSFTCDADTTLSWSTTNCTSISINTSPVTSSPTSGSKTINAYSTTYTLTAGANTSYATCPAGPTLSATWNDGTQTINRTVSPGVQPSEGFTFRKSGSGTLKFSKCRINGLNGETTSINCPFTIGADIGN